MVLKGVNAKKADIPCLLFFLPPMENACPWQEDTKKVSSSIMGYYLDEWD